MIIANKYKIIERLGSGAFSEIYKGENIRTKELVAIKFELSELKAFFSNDALISSRFFPSSVLKQNGIIQHGIVLYEFIINTVGIITYINDQYSLTTENTETIMAYIIDTFVVTTQEVSSFAI